MAKRGTQPGTAAAMPTQEIMALLRTLQEKLGTPILPDITPVEDKLALMAQLDDEMTAKTAAIDAQLHELAQQRAQLIAADVEARETLAEQVKEECLHRKATIKGQSLQVIYSMGPRAWMSDVLDEYAKDHPEISYFRKPQTPFASIRKLNGNG